MARVMVCKMCGAFKGRTPGEYCSEKCLNESLRQSMEASEPAAVSPSIISAIENTPARIGTMTLKPFRTCPRCGATSDTANFSTLPPLCDDCA